MKTLMLSCVMATMMTGVVIGAEEAPAQDAAPAITPDAVSEVNKVATTPVPPLTASSLVRKDMAAFCEEAGITIGETTPKGSIYLEGLKRVDANVRSPDFIRMRALNFTEAYSEAVSKYVMDKSGRTVIEQYRETFHDESSDLLQPSRNLKTTVERIAEKTEQLTEAQLDEGLRKLGVTPAGSITEKRDQVRKVLTKNSINDAVGSAAGLSTVQTFEGWDEKGNYAVGCVIRGGVDTEAIAEALQYKRRPAMVRPDKGIDVKDAIPTDEELVSQFGVRVIFDRDGVPALLSFGQWGSAYTGTDEEIAEDAMEHAQRQAKAEADDYLTMFINSSISIHQESSRGRDKRATIEFDSNSVPTSKDIKNIVDKHLETARLKGTDTMIGRSTVCEKVITHPSGHKVAVCVRMWSFHQYDAMKRIIEKSTQPTRRAVSPVVAPPSRSGTRRGRTYDF